MDIDIQWKHLYPALDDDDNGLGKTYSDNINKASDGIPLDPVGAFLKNMADAQMMKSSDWDWNESVTGRRIELSEDFLKRSAARVERVAGKLREMFGEHTEEAEEAIAIVQNIFHAEREAVIGRHAA